jgi:hypothetical protein
MVTKHETIVRATLDRLNNGPDFERLRRLVYLSFDAPPPFKGGPRMSLHQRRIAGRAVRLARRFQNAPPGIVAMSPVADHDEACCRLQARQESERRAYAAAWPRACKSCHAAGGFSSTYDPSPSGVHLGGGEMPEYDPCEKCAAPAKGKPTCPRCGRSSRTMMSEDEQSCSLCGHADGCLLPPQPDECGCAYRNDYYPTPRLDDLFAGRGGRDSARLIDPEALEISINAGPR